MIKIIHFCPSSVATGGTESIHKLVSEFNKIEDVEAKILYVGKDLSNPQPKEYEEYGCEYITELPEGYKEVVIFPEIWANKVIEPEYKDCVTAVNWAGVDVYDWNVPPSQRGLFLQNEKTVHLCQLQYAVDHLKKLKVKNIMRISDVLNDAFFEDYREFYRKDIVLYNPSPSKMTRFTHTVKQRLITEYGVQCIPLEGYNREELIELMKKAKLYIDFGVFSGRERLPRESAVCGCCIITSNSGAAGYHEDLAIPDKYKFGEENINDAMRMAKEILKNFRLHQTEFYEYVDSIQKDRLLLPEQCKEVVRRFRELCQDSQ